MSFKSRRLDLVFIIIGNILIAVGVSCFTVPSEIPAGGFTGIATILHSLFGLPIGTSVLLMNIPIFVLAAGKFGIKFLYKSIISTVIMTVFIDLASSILPVYKGEMILSSIFGGVIMGVGLAIVFLRGATTGGVDILAKLISLKIPHFSIGNIILILDTAVIISSAIVYRNIEKALFATIVIFAQSKAIDYIIYGFDKGKLILVKSDFCKEIIENASIYLGRKPTLISNESESRNILLCATHRYEAAKFHKVVKLTDKSALIITLDAGEIFGEGFKNFNESS